MLIQCVICSDLITHNAIADIIGLACGHIFHGLCLRTWLERSATCPHCRSKVSDSKQFKIFMTIAPEPEGQDIVTLTRTVDNLKYELKLKSMECGTLSKDLETYKKKANGLVKEVRKLETHKASSAEITLQLNEQRKYANHKAKELCEAKFIIESLETELKQYQTLKTLVNKSSTEVDCGVDVNSLDSSQLAFLLSTFKTDSTKLSKMNEDLKKVLSKSESEKISLIKKKDELEESLCLKDRVIDSLKESLSKSKIKQMSFKKKKENADVANSSSTSEMLNTSILSHSPLRTEPEQSNSMDRVQQEKENQQLVQPPAKKLKESLVSKAEFRITSNRMRSVSQMGTSLKSSVNSQGFNYDGLGGHSKEDVFRSTYRFKPGLANPRRQNNKHVKP